MGPGGGSPPPRASDRVKIQALYWRNERNTVSLREAAAAPTLHRASPPLPPPPTSTSKGDQPRASPAHQLHVSPKTCTSATGHSSRLACSGSHAIILSFCRLSLMGSFR